jgi:metallo-beta-lactamase class B
MRAPPLASPALLATISLLAAAAASAEAPPDCASCAVWNLTQAPFRLYGNAYYVGVRGLSSVLITSDKGHILIDGDLPESAAKIAASVRELGFRVEDIKLIVNSHDHSDHAGGIAELQRLSGAKVAASAPSAKVLQAGKPESSDPQSGILLPIATVAHVQVFKDGETLRVGPLAITAHLTPGHTAGGTSWTWQSCEKDRCLNMVYADSLSALSSPGYKFTAHPEVVKSFEKSFATVAALPCDILVTPHPEAANLWARLAKRDEDHDPSGLVDTQACKMYVAGARTRLRERVADESKK